MGGHKPGAEECTFLLENLAGRQRQAAAFELPARDGHCAPGEIRSEICERCYRGRTLEDAIDAHRHRRIPLLQGRGDVARRRRVILQTSADFVNMLRLSADSQFRSI